MSRFVCVAHTGQRLRIDAVSFPSLDDFRTWVSHNAAIPVQSQIHMTARGKQVKYQQLQSEEEIFVYDKQLIQTPSDSASTRQVPQTPVPAPFHPEPPPDQLSSQTELESWQELFKARRGWALDLARKSSAMVEAVRKHAREAEIVERALGVAVSNMGMHIGGLETIHSESQSWATGMLEDHSQTLQDWEEAFDKLRQVPVRADVLAFIARHSVKTTLKGSKMVTTSGAEATLSDLFALDEVRSATNLTKAATKRFHARLANIEGLTSKVLLNGKNLSESVSRTLEYSTLDTLKKAEDLLVDIEILKKKMGSDYEHVLTLDRASSKSVPQASKMALLHTREYVVNMKNRSMEMGGHFRTVIEQRNALAKASVKHLQTISHVQSMLTTLTPQIHALDFGEEAADAIDLLRLLSRVPFIYGSCLIEALRRHDWSENLKSESSRLAEDLAVLRDEEEKRRRKWFRHTGELIWREQIESSITGVEINLKGDEKTWPTVAKKDVEAYVGIIRNLGNMHLVADEIEQLLKDLDKPSKQRTKRVKAFKMGSVHDAALARSSMLAAPEDGMVRNLNEDKVKLEEKLKGSEARVRRLEDILHRTTTMNRNTTGNLFQPFNPPTGESDSNHVPHFKQVPTPLPPSTHESISRRSSVSSRRISLNVASDDKSLVQRIVVLEAEIVAEREKSSSLQKEVIARRDSEDSTKNKLEELDSTKQDLMKNLEAQKKEFDGERKLLEDANRKMRDRLEEAEDDVERVLGSRDHEKMDHEREIQALKESAAIDSAKIQNRLEIVLNEVAQSRGKAEQINEQRRRAVEEISMLTSRITGLEQEVENHKEDRSGSVETMRLAHTRLAPGQAPPQGIAALAIGIESLALKSANYVKSIESALAMTRADKEAIESNLHSIKELAATTKAKLGVEEMESFTLRETLAQEKAKASILGSEIREHLEELTNLRARFAEGETGSETLKTQLSEQESKAAALIEELAAKQGQIKITEAELERTKTKLQAMQINENIASSRQTGTASHALELSHRLFTQHERLLKLLTDLGFAVFRQDEVMAIQRASKVNASITEAADGSVSQLRQPEGNMRSPSLDMSMSPNLVQWTSANDARAEAAQFDTFVTAVQMFDLDLFCTTLGKRMTQLETIARKAQKDARAYRDRAHRLQRESAEKIAYRSFREGDLALFLPTRNQPVKAWAAFNVGAPHHFLRPENDHHLAERDWLVARISKKEERIVDLKSTPPSPNSQDPDWNNNPFDLSDGLRWYLLHATENISATPAPYPLSVMSKSKSTVTSTSIAAESVPPHPSSSATAGTVARNLTKSLDSRRSSTASRHSASMLREAVLNSNSGAIAVHDRENSRGSSRSGTNPAVEAVKNLDLGLVSSPNAGTSRTLVDDHAGQSQVQAPKQSNSEARKTPADRQLVSTPEQQSASKKASLEKQNSTLWDTLWSLDVSIERGGNGKGGSTTGGTSSK